MFKTCNIFYSFYTKQFSNMNIRQINSSPSPNTKRPPTSTNAAESVTPNDNDSVTIEKRST